MLSGVYSCQVQGDREGTTGQPEAGKLQDAQADRCGALHVQGGGWGSGGHGVARCGQDPGQGAQPRHQRRHQAHSGHEDQ